MALGRLPENSKARARLIDLAALVVGGVATLALAGYFAIDLAAPANLAGDHVFSLAEAKSLIDGHGFRFNPQLGFPAGQDVLYFPSFDLSYRLLLWLMARVTDSPFLSFHALYLVGLPAMFAAGFWAMRLFGIRTWIAAFGAMSTVLTPYLVARAFGHDFLALSFSAPLGFGLALSVGMQSAETSLKRFLTRPFTLAAILIVGISGLYYAFFSLMLLAFVGVSTAIGQRRWFPILAASGVAAPLFLLVILSGYGPDLLTTGQISGPHRTPADQLAFGINLPAAVMAFQAIPKVAENLAITQQMFPAAFVNEGTGEWPAWPLTLVILATPLIAAACQRRRGHADVETLADRRVVLMGLCALCVVFALLFGARGGLGYLFNVLVTGQIRAGSRLMPFLTFGAALILCLGAEMAAAAHARWLRIAGPAAAALLLAASIYPSVGDLAGRVRANLAAPRVQAMRDGVPRLLAAKDRAGLHTVLQLPAASWPDEPPLKTFDPYHQLLPYLYDRRGSGTRWSYGASDRQPVAAALRFTVRQPADLAAHARAFGFDGLMIQKGGYDPAALQALQTALGAQLSPQCRVYEDELMALYALSRGPGGARC